jgi:hypothetical protein
VLTRIISAPGVALQKITTKEPDDRMIECAIAAFSTVAAMDADESIPERIFPIGGKMTELLQSVKDIFNQSGIDEEEAEWIFALKLGLSKSAVSAGEEYIVKRAQAEEIMEMVEERLTGRPLWYVYGDADFCGYTMKVDERVLIPRRETEELVMHVVASATANCEILDLCTGSGAIAIAVAKELEKRRVPASITASDVSADALALALNFFFVEFSTKPSISEE